jgi:hypothetical protein
MAMPLRQISGIRGVMVFHRHEAAGLALLKYSERKLKSLSEKGTGLLKWC